VQPPTLEGALAYMGLQPGEFGRDAHDYRWATGDDERLQQAS
jgi:toluene monooxygenase system protein A